MTNITRRGALFTGMSLIGASAAACQGESVDFPVAFKHGVASGDPGTDRMVIWTRISPEQDGTFSGRWQVSKTRDFKRISHKGKLQTSLRRDYTLKVDVQGLQPGQTYYYRFKVGQYTSPVGRTKTLPIGTVEQARFAVVSCSNYPFGYFNVYDHIAGLDNLDAVIHLGDYIYEYGENGYGRRMGRELGRVHNPSHETVSLGDYRTRHAQYKSDPASQAMHAAHPLIAIWDDHETANNSWMRGAQNHGRSEGSWDIRRASALQAYYEWMPVRDPEPDKTREALFRAYAYGDLLNLTTLETRLSARHEELDYKDYQDGFTSHENIETFVRDVLWDKNREILGAVQSDFVVDNLARSKQSGQSWRILANQIIMARTTLPDLSDWKEQDFIEDLRKRFWSIDKFIAISPFGLPMNLDAWDGYPAARERLYERLKAQDVQDLLVLTGDTHMWWANQLHTKSGQSMGVELATAAVTSPGFGTYLGAQTEDYETRMMATNKEIEYLSASSQGYIDLHLNHKQGRADYVCVDTVLKPDYKTSICKSFKLRKEGGTVKLGEV